MANFTPIGLRLYVGDSDSFYSGKTVRAGYLSIFTTKGAKGAKEDQRAQRSREQRDVRTWIWLIANC